jgi:hypothetical protein
MVQLTGLIMTCQHGLIQPGTQDTLFSNVEERATLQYVTNTLWYDYERGVRLNNPMEVSGSQKMRFSWYTSILQAFP